MGQVSANTVKVINGVTVYASFGTERYGDDKHTLAEKAAAVQAAVDGMPGEEPKRPAGNPFDEEPGVLGGGAALALPVGNTGETSGYPDQAASEKQLAAAGVTA